MENYDQEIEKNHHRENFEPVPKCPVCKSESIAENPETGEIWCNDCGEQVK